MLKFQRQEGLEVLEVWILVGLEIHGGDPRVGEEFLPFKVCSSGDDDAHRQVTNGPHLHVDRVVR